MDSTKIVLCGDFVAKNPEIIKFSDSLKEILNSADVRVCNFEAPVESNGLPVPKSGPSLSQSTESPQLLEDKGFNVILAANNHIMDYGNDGFEATKNKFHKSIIVGAGSPEEAYRCQIIERNGKKIGFLSFCQYENGIVESPEDKRKYGVAWLCSLDVEDIIRQSKKDVDFLFVCPHAGLEDFDAPLPEWRALYKKFIIWGADAVVASHPHVPQGWEIYQSKPIFYSLGNFYFDALSGVGYWNKSLIVEIEVGDTVKFKVYNSIFEDGVIDIDTSSDIKIHNDLINNYLKDDSIYIPYIHDCCLKRYPGYVYGLHRGLCAFSFSGMNIKWYARLFALMLLRNSDKQTYLNTLRCETHRWVMQRVINKLK